MKKSILIIFLVLAILKSQAQDYLISFAGTGETNVVDTVKIDNLSSGATVTLNGGDTLHLIEAVGIGNPDNNNRTLQIYPNPMTEQSMLTFVTPGNGSAVICISDLSGKPVYQISSILSSGKHSFRVHGLNQGMYFVKVTGKNYNYSAKLISLCKLQSNAGIEYVSSLKNTTSSLLKSTAATIDMPYTTGDQLLYKGISGIYSTLVPDVPTSSKTITFNFVTCTDNDGNNYTIVEIGVQTWMAENLNVGVRINGIQNQTNNGIIEKYCHSDDVNNCTTYGGLYQWDEMMQYVTTQGAKGICPDGWHLPSDAEWTTLTDYLGGELVAGGKMKSTGTMQAGTGLWNTPNAGATNSSGFTGLPGGYRDIYGAFYYLGNNGLFWSSSQFDVTYTWFRDLYCYNPSVHRDYTYKADGYSARCLQD
ncbi:MAG: T9SS C-terminal target domain-containing protein [Bacteroidetes bacterium]|nr:MAG: T9SS C-terminal target domain-containing protein [Bacteroidota bacterium]